VAGRLEVVDGRLWLMPPCGDEQQDVVASLVGVLEPWSADHVGFVVGANEAGMILEGEIRGADAAVWRRGDAEPRTGGYRRKAPILAVEVGGRGEDEAALRGKAEWYLSRGVSVVWNVLPSTREIVVIDVHGETRHGVGSELPSRPELPDLRVTVDRVFRQL
jgi:Uma2 family endonuclease